jgi:hypothetical protein
MKRLKPYSIKSFLDGYKEFFSIHCAANGGDEDIKVQANNLFTGKNLEEGTKMMLNILN